ncbi:MAG: hypothetical protein NC453_11805 [Muribaculum sp.]|nr:hypothetical protein [Muribaculum sp.]
MKNKTIPASMIEVLADKYIYQEAEQENAELGHALKNISEENLRGIFKNHKPRVITFKKVIRERIAWTLSMAAMLAIAITVPFHINNQSMDKMDGLIYSYNMPMLVQNAARGGESTIDITALNDAQLKASLPKLEEEFQDSDNLQDVALNGRVLALAYIRTHNRAEAKSTLKSMITRLSAEPDGYEEIIKWCEQLIKQLD